MMLLAAFALISVLLGSCKKYETYAEQKENEVNAIKSYIAKKGIKVISESEFFAKDSTTDVDENEYVLFNSSGVYMQIVHKGCGSKIKNGETVKVLCRFEERYVMTDSLRLTSLPRYTDNMIVTNNNGTMTATFINTQTQYSQMASAYNTTSVPSGWLVPSLISRWDGLSARPTMWPKSISSCPTPRDTPTPRRTWPPISTTSPSSAACKKLKYIKS